MVQKILKLYFNFMGLIHWRFPKNLLRGDMVYGGRIDGDE
jgi:hypothetical protein